MRPCCPRCSRPTVRVDVDELVTHYRCRHDDCERPHPLYQGEHPLRFWTLFLVELAKNIAVKVRRRLR